MDLEHGIPSHDTFGRVFRWLDEAAFQEIFIKWTESLCQVSAGQVLARLDITSCIVTVDALNCQTDIAQKIVEAHADYLLAVKANQGTVYEDLALLFDGFETDNYQGVVFDSAKTVSEGHDRREHWILDIAFREDESRIRKDHAPQNMAVLRHIALSLLKQETSVHVGIAAKRKMAGWNNDYLLKVLCLNSIEN